MTSESDDDHGITMTDMRETGSDPWSRVFVADEIEGREFPTLRECVAALRELLPKAEG